MFNLVPVFSTNNLPDCPLKPFVIWGWGGTDVFFKVRGHNPCQVSLFSVHVDQVQQEAANRGLTFSSCDDAPSSF